MYISFHPNKGQLAAKVYRLYGLENSDSTHIVTFTSAGTDVTDQVNIFLDSLSDAQRLVNLLNRSLIDLAAEEEEYKRQQEEGERVRS